MIYRMRNKLRDKKSPGPLLLALGALLLLVSGCVGPGHYTRPGFDAKSIKRIAVLPLESFTADDYAGEKVRRVVITELMSKGVDVIEPGEISRILREREAGFPPVISAEDIRSIGKTLDVDMVMAGSVGAFNIRRGISVSYPEVSVHLELIEASSGRIIWSAWHTSGGPSFWTRHFGTEGNTLSEASRDVVRKAIGTLF
jgi:TolB-like protein